MLGKQQVVFALTIKNIKSICSNHVEIKYIINLVHHVALGGM